jgi:hypothetical protein
LLTTLAALLATLAALLSALTGLLRLLLTRLLVLLTAALLLPALAALLVLLAALILVVLVHGILLGFLPTEDNRIGGTLVPCNRGTDRPAASVCGGIMPLERAEVVVRPA